METKIPHITSFKIKNMRRIMDYSKIESKNGVHYAYLAVVEGLLTKVKRNLFLKGFGSFYKESGMDKSRKCFKYSLILTFQTPADAIQAETYLKNNKIDYLNSSKNKKTIMVKSKPEDYSRLTLLLKQMESKKQSALPRRKRPSVKGRPKINPSVKKVKVENNGTMPDELSSITEPKQRWEFAKLRLMKAGFGIGQGKVKNRSGKTSEVVSMSCEEDKYVKELLDFLLQMGFSRDEIELYTRGYGLKLYVNNKMKPEPKKDKKPIVAKEKPSAESVKQQKPSSITETAKKEEELPEARAIIASIRFNSKQFQKLLKQATIEELFGELRSRGGVEGLSDEKLIQEIRSRGTPFLQKILLQLKM